MIQIIIKRGDSKAGRRRHCVGGGATVNFGRRCGAPRSQQFGGGGSAKLFSKISEKISFYPQNIVTTFFSHQKLQQNKYIATMASAARRQIIGGGALIPQIVGGGS